MPPALTLDHIGLSVVDIEASIDWYTSKLGFTTQRRYTTVGIDFAFLTHGNITLEIIAGATSNAKAPVTDIVASLDPARLHHFCVVVDDLDGTLDELRSQDVHVVGDPLDVEVLDQRVAFVTDNEGNVIELCSPGLST